MKHFGGERVADDADVEGLRRHDNDFFYIDCVMEMGSIIRGLASPTRSQISVQSLQYHKLTMTYLFRVNVCSIVMDPEDLNIIFPLYPQNGLRRPGSLIRLQSCRNPHSSYMYDMLYRIATSMPKARNVRRDQSLNNLPCTRCYYFLLLQNVYCKPNEGARSPPAASRMPTMMIRKDFRAISCGSRKIDAAPHKCLKVRSSSEL